MLEPMNLKEGEKMGNLMNWKTGLLGGLMLAVTANGMGTYSEQPLRFRCNVSTRVVAGTLLVGIDPVLGYLAYELDKYHANDSTQTYKKSGQVGAHVGGTVTFENVGRQTVISAVSRSSKKNSFKMEISRCGAPGAYPLTALKIDEMDHAFQGAQCERVN
jgi:hypothetical protein